jgi:hypothetical protein
MMSGGSVGGLPYRLKNARDLLEFSVPEGSMTELPTSTTRRMLDLYLHYHFLTRGSDTKV